MESGTSLREIIQELIDVKKVNPPTDMERYETDQVEFRILEKYLDKADEIAAHENILTQKNEQLTQQDELIRQLQLEIQQLRFQLSQATVPNPGHALTEQAQSAGSLSSERKRERDVNRPQMPLRSPTTPQRGSGGADASARSRASRTRDAEAEPPSKSPRLEDFAGSPISGRQRLASRLARTIGSDSDPFTSPFTGAGLLSGMESTSFQVPEGDRPVTPGQLGPDHPTHSSASSPMKNRDKGKARDDSGTPVQDPAGEGDGSGLAAGFGDVTLEEETGSGPADTDLTMADADTELPVNPSDDTTLQPIRIRINHGLDIDKTIIANETDRKAATPEGLRTIKANMYRVFEEVAKREAKQAEKRGEPLPSRQTQSDDEDEAEGQGKKRRKKKGGKLPKAMCFHTAAVGHRNLTSLDWSYPQYMTNKTCPNCTRILNNKGYQQCLRILDRFTLLLLNPLPGDAEKQAQCDRQNGFRYVHDDINRTAIIRVDPATGNDLPPPVVRPGQAPVSRPMLPPPQVNRPPRTPTQASGTSAPPQTRPDTRGSDRTYGVPTPSPSRQTHDLLRQGGRAHGSALPSYARPTHASSSRQKQPESIAASREETLMTGQEEAEEEEDELYTKD